VLSPSIMGTGKAVHFVPSKWIADWPTAQMSLGEDAETAYNPLLKFSLGVCTT